MAFHLALVFVRNTNNTMRIHELTVAEELSPCHFVVRMTLFGHDFRRRGIYTLSSVQMALRYKDFISEMLEENPSGIEIYYTNAYVRGWSKKTLGNIQNIRYVMLTTRTFVNKVSDSPVPFFPGYVAFPKFGPSELCKYHDLKVRENKYNYYEDSCSLPRIREMAAARTDMRYDDLQASGLLMPNRWNVYRQESWDKYKDEYTTDMTEKQPPEADNEEWSRSMDELEKGVQNSMTLDAVEELEEAVTLNVVT